MLICSHCGEHYEESELKYVRESHGEVHCDYTCHCGGELVGARKCLVCGEDFDNTDLHGVCEACLEEYETVETAVAIGSYSTVKREINGFFAHILTTEMINSILEKWVEENYVDHCQSVIDYLENDKSAYSEYLECEYGE